MDIKKKKATIIPIKTPGKKKESENRHSAIRLSGVPPIMPINPKKRRQNRATDIR